MNNPRATRLPDLTSVTMPNLVNGDTVTLARGMVVGTANAAGKMKRASAASDAVNGIGLCVSTPGGPGVAPDFSGDVQSSGIFVMADWTAIVGTTTLIHGAEYFLSVTPGMLSATPPSIPGQVLQSIGKAVNATTLKILIGPAILL